MEVNNNKMPNNNVDSNNNAAFEKAFQEQIVKTGSVLMMMTVGSDAVQETLNAGPFDPLSNLADL